MSANIRFQKVQYCEMSGVLAPGEEFNQELSARDETQFIFLVNTDDLTETHMLTLSSSDPQRLLDSLREAADEIEDELNSMGLLNPPRNDGLTWPWPVDEPAKGLGGGGGIHFDRDISALKAMGYTVGVTHGRPLEERCRFLEMFFRNALPDWVEEHFGDDYGEPGSEERLKKMANTIAAHIRNFTRKDPEAYAQAIADWRNDLGHLRTTFYEPGGHRFPWPPIEP